MKVLITGAGGQLGRDLLDAFVGHQVTGLARCDLDVADEAAVAEVVGDLGPDLVVNAAAWTAVDACEADPERAHRINALGPWWLARACERIGATLLTVSTDYVFDGIAPAGPAGTVRGYTEFDPVGPINVYGRSKAAGEQLVRDTLGTHHIVRTSWVSGATGSNFVTAMLRLARERDRLTVVADQHGAPTYTRDLAAAIRRAAVSGRYGTWNLTNAGSCSWHEYASAIVELAGLDTPVDPIPTTDWPTPAARPAWSVLDGTHAVTCGIGPLPHWRDGLSRLLDELGELRSPAVGIDERT